MLFTFLVSVPHFHRRRDRKGIGLVTEVVGKEWFSLQVNNYSFNINAASYTAIRLASTSGD